MSANRSQIDAFLDMLTVERSASENTIAAYRRDLNDAAGFLAVLGKDLIDADREALAAWQQSLATDGLAASTIARRISALRQFYRFEVEEGGLETNPALALSSPEAQRDVPNVLSREAVGALLEACIGDHPKDKRDLCLLGMVYSLYYFHF